MSIERKILQCVNETISLKNEIKNWSWKKNDHQLKKNANEKKKKLKMKNFDENEHYKANHKTQINLKSI